MPTSPGPGGKGNDNSDSQGGIDTVRVKFTAGAAGAVPTFPLDMSNRVVSVTKSNTTGQYDIVFVSSDYQLGGFFGHNLQASFAAGGAGYPILVAYSSANATATVQFCKGSDGTAAYLASGDKCVLVFQRQRYRSQ